MAIYIYGKAEQKMTMYLMHRDIPTAIVETERNVPVTYSEIINRNELPIGTYHENKSTRRLLWDKWVKSRTIPSTRPDIRRLEQFYGKTVSELFMQSAGISLTDGYYFTENPENRIWDKINYHKNGFEEAILKSKMKLWIQVGQASPDFTTDGIMDKFWYQIHGLPYLAKLDKEHHNLLCANEVFYAKIAGMIGVSCVDYNLGHFMAEKEKIYYCSCQSFITNPDEDFITAMQIKHEHMRLDRIGLLDHIIGLGFEKEMREMMTLDCIFHNTDRHEKNFGIIRHINGSIRMAPLYDNGYCFGINHPNTDKITDRDMRLLPDSREQILDRYGCEIHIDKDTALSILEHIYVQYQIEDNAYEKAKNELLYGLELYGKWQQKQHVYGKEYMESEIEYPSL